MKKKKMIQVLSKTHELAKKLATERGMTLEGYIKKVIEKDYLEWKSENDKIYNS